MNGTELLLRIKYAPETLSEGSNSVEIDKAVHTLPIETRIALANAQGLPEFVIKALLNQDKGTE